MKIHEYQAKNLMSHYSIPVPKGKVARTAAQAREIAAELGGKVVIKAQVHAGGRGKGGGIVVAGSPEEAERLAGQMLGRALVTPQTGPEGVPVRALLIEEAVPIERELYLGIVVDASRGLPVIMASEAGGMEIEEMAAQSPERIHKAHIDPAVGFQSFHGRRLAFAIDLSSQLRPTTQLIANLYRLFWEKDCSLAEINPLVVTSEGGQLALDAKLNFDDNALFRHKDIAELHDPEQEDPLEVQAVSMGINNYIKLDGDIGCVVNGAGLAMSVMDTVKLAGGEPANFLDIGTINDPHRVVNAFKILTADPQVKAVLINIFGGIARVDVIAAGLVEASRQLDLRVPIVVRLAGTNLAEGERILAESGLNLIRASSLYEAAQKAVAAAAGKGGQA